MNHANTQESHGMAKRSSAYSIDNVGKYKWHN